MRREQYNTTLKGDTAEQASDYEQERGLTKKSEVARELIETGLQHHQIVDNALSSWWLYLALTSVLAFFALWSAVIVAGLPAAIAIAFAPLPLFLNFGWALRLATALRTVNGGK